MHTMSSILLPYASSTVNIYVNMCYILFIIIACDIYLCTYYDIDPCVRMRGRDRREILLRSRRYHRGFWGITAITYKLIVVVVVIPPIITILIMVLAVIVTLAESVWRLSWRTRAGS